MIEVETAEPMPAEELAAFEQGAEPTTDEVMQEPETSEDEEVFNHMVSVIKNHDEVIAHLIAANNQQAMDIREMQQAFTMLAHKVTEVLQLNQKPEIIRTSLPQNSPLNRF